MMRTSTRQVSRYFVKSSAAGRRRVLAGSVLWLFSGCILAEESSGKNTPGLPNPAEASTVPVESQTSASLKVPRLTNAEQANVFDEAIHILGGNVNVQSKWIDNIRFTIIGQASAAAREQVSITLQDIAGQTGLAVSNAENPYATASDFVAAIEQSPKGHWRPCTQKNTMCANLLILVTDVDAMRDVAQAVPLRPVYLRSLADTGGASCFFSPFINQRKEIVGALVFVSSDLAEPMLRTCLQEEIYQSFGLFNDFSGSNYFSFNNIVAPKSITHYDRTLLTSIYDPAFQPGTPVFRVTARFMELLGYEQFRR